MKWIAALQATLTAVVVTCAAQEARPLNAADDISLRFQTQGNRQDFRVGEVIPVEYSFAGIPGRYVYLSRADQLVSGRPFEITCTPPPAQQIESRGDSDRFREMLVDPDCGGGVGSGGGGGCGDCDGEIPVSATPIRFQTHLHQFVRLRQPGTYSCTASSAQITSVAHSGTPRNALTVQSSPVQIRIVDDPAWAHSAALEYSRAFQAQCRDESLQGTRLLQCFDISQRLAHLDTPESVAAMIRFFDGRHHSWKSGFWAAIEASTHRGEVLRLMKARVQDRDVEVSPWLLSSLAMWSLKADVPDAFHPTAPPAVYHNQAQDRLRDYVRLLGASLRTKTPDVIGESVKTYRMFAESRSCSGETLLPQAEKDAAIASVPQTSHITH